MAERKIQIILEWLETHPESFESVRSKISALATANMQATNMSLKSAKTTEEQTRVMEASGDVYRDHAVSLYARNIPAIGQFLDIEREMEDQQEASKKRWEDSLKSMKRVGNTVSSIGVRFGWLGYRLTMMGRMILRFLTKPIQDAIRVLRDWDKTMADLAYTIGVLTYTGMGSADMIATLTDTLTKLPEVGLMIQAAFGALEGVFATIAVDIGPLLAEAVIEIAEALLDVWKEVSPTLIPALKSLKGVLNTLLDIIRDVGPAMAVGFVEGLKSGIVVLEGFLIAIKPILPALAYLAGFLVPFAPLLLALGMALYFISPLLMTLGTLFKVVAVLAGALHIAMVPLVAAIGAIIAAVLVGVTVFTLLKDKIGVVPAAIAALVAAIITGIAVFYGLSAAMGAISAAVAGVGTTIAGVGTAVAAGLAPLTPVIPVILALGAAAALVGAAFLMAGLGVKFAAEGIVELANHLEDLVPLVPVLLGIAAGMLGIAAAGIAMLPGAVGIAATTVALFGLAASIMALTASIWALVAAAKAFETVGGTLKSIIGGIGNVLGGLGNALKKLCFIHATPLAEAFSQSLAATRDQAIEATETVSDLSTALRHVPPTGVGVGGGVGRAEGGPQYIDVYASISIGTITGTADLGMVQDAVSKGIAEGIRRRR